MGAASGWQGEAGGYPSCILYPLKENKSDWARLQAGSPPLVLSGQAGSLDSAVYLSLLDAYVCAMFI